ncbi:MAG: hypothetical protein QM778_05550 [Myxococcales bacterium]
MSLPQRTPRRRLPILLDVSWWFVVLLAVLALVADFTYPTLGVALCLSFSGAAMALNARTVPATLTRWKAAWRVGCLLCALASWIFAGVQFAQLAWEPARRPVSQSRSPRTGD